MIKDSKSPPPSQSGQAVSTIRNILFGNARQFLIENLILLFDVLFVIVIVKMFLQ